MSRCVSLNHALANASANSCGFSMEAPRDLLVGRIEPEREVRRQHRRRDLLRRIVGVRHRACAGAVLRLPLLRAGRALRQLPLVLEEVLEEVVAPLGRRRGPGAFEAAGDGMGALAGFVAVLPAKPCSSRLPPSGSGPTWVAGPAPWVLPNVWPPAISATVSSSFIAMRRRSRGCRVPTPPDPGCRSALPGSRR